MFHVMFNLVSHDGFPPVSAEEIDAMWVGKGLCRLVGIPIFVCGIAPGDTARVRESPNGELWAMGSLHMRIIGFSGLLRLMVELVLERCSVLSDEGLRNGAVGFRFLRLDWWP